MTSSPILNVMPLPPGPWPTLDPFLFCVHHDDRYPSGNAAMEPNSTLAGRDIGQDFSGKDGWSMYHGDRVPGFPRHPHRGFETVTVARRGFIDHSDSLGAAARFGQGDLQWMTAGRGIVHSEMFPLLNQKTSNHTELFQIWLNLPSKDKMAEPHFSMFWKDRIPSQEFRDGDGNEILVTIYAGALPNGGVPPNPPPRSWASAPDNAIAIWTIRLAPNATWDLPAADPLCNRQLFYFRGSDARIAGNPFNAGQAIQLNPSDQIEVKNGTEESEFLVLQGKPIGEPVAQYGPFVMNTRAELRQAFEDYQRTAFGGWNWLDSGPVHARDTGRFARFADGNEGRPEE